ncbi:hypothetical protein AMTRI_Chr01g109970 [Amborella trichopoda]|uniref:Uncharacterized protein n=1 Tax=Amborella trichopoda TaxID=13333 RepID=W1NP86_AMBTC|nr:hypothetical protein AMTR_s00170p00046120 [Amborella trichopoda]
MATIKIPLCLYLLLVFMTCPALGAIIQGLDIEATPKQTQEIIASKEKEVGLEKEKTVNFGEMYLHVLPRGRVPPSSPSRRGHKRVSGNRHLLDSRTPLINIQHNRRGLKRSVPSPGIGH